MTSFAFDAVSNMLSLTDVVANTRMSPCGALGASRRNLMTFQATPVSTWADFSFP